LMARPKTATNSTETTQYNMIEGNIVVENKGKEARLQPSFYRVLLLQNKLDSIEEL
jgi:hypothetical protein